MIFSDFEVDVRKGSFKIELDRPCQFYVGLVAFHLPSIDDPDVPHNGRPKIDPRPSKVSFLYIK